MEEEEEKGNSSFSTEDRTWVIFTFIRRESGTSVEPAQVSCFSSSDYFAHGSCVFFCFFIFNLKYCCCFFFRVEIVIVFKRQCLVECVISQ